MLVNKQINFLKYIGLLLIIISAGTIDKSQAIRSAYTDNPPNIDGNIDFGEWNFDETIELEHGLITVLNDNIRLYILADLLDDVVDDSHSLSSLGDEFELIFDVDKNGELTGADRRYVLMPATYNMRLVYPVDPMALALEGSMFSDYTRSSMASGFGCFIADGTYGFRLEPPGRSCDEHRVWEFGIDLNEIGAQPGDTVRVGFQFRSQNPRFLDKIPSGLDYSNLLEIELDPSPSPLIADEVCRELCLTPELPCIDVCHPFLSNPSIDSLEITQAIQTEDNDMPLVEGKKTVARVYAHTSEENPQLAVIYLYGSRDGDDLPGSPLSMALSCPIDIDRLKLDSSANFILPNTWTKGTIRLQARVSNLFGMVEESTPLSLTFQPKETPVYWIIPINVGTDDEPIVISHESLSRSKSYVETVYPVREVQFVIRDWTVIGAITSPIHPDELDTREEYYEWGVHVNRILERLRDYYNTIEVARESGEDIGYPFPDQIIGIIPLGGVADSGDSGGSGRVVLIDDREAGIAHEIDHNLGNILASDASWGHHVSDPTCYWDEELGWRPVYNRNWGCRADCGPDWQWPWINDEIQDIGFDTREPWVDGSDEIFTIIPSIWPDFMSYCHHVVPGDPFTSPGGIRANPDRWISTYRWLRLSSFFAESGPDLRRLMKQNVYYISGQVNRDGTGNLNPVFVQPGIPHIIDPAKGATLQEKNGSIGASNGQATSEGYSIEIQDLKGKTLTSLPFILSFSRSVEFLDREQELNKSSDSEISLELETVRFGFTLPGQSCASKILLKEGKSILDIIEISENAPEITVVKPKEGDIWSSGLHTIQWIADDKDEDQLNFTILYSPDDGKTWLPVAWDVQGESYELDTSVLPGGDAARVRVIVTDGFNTNQDDSSAFKVTGKPPSVSITRPETDTKLYYGEILHFKGEATDLEDYAIADESFIWSYDSTVFGVGKEVAARLPDNVQRVTLTVFDSEGNAAQDAVLIKRCECHSS